MLRVNIAVLLTLIVCVLGLAPPAPAQAAPVSDYCLTTWERLLDEERGVFVWWPPHVDHALGWLDLRNQEQKESQIFSGYVFVGYDQSMTGLLSVCYGDDLEATLTSAQIGTIELLLGRDRGSITARDWRNVLWNMYTINSSPDGSDGPKPLIPNHRGVMSLRLAGQVLKDERVRAGSHPAWPKIEERLQLDYRDIYEKVQSGEYPADTHQKVLGNWRNKYSTDNYQRFIPGDLPDEGFREPTTTVTDDFNRADSSSLGAAWSEIDGDFEILSNQLIVTDPSDNIAVHTTSLSSDDHYCSFTVIVDDLNDWGGCGIRITDVNNWIWARYIDRSGATDHNVNINSNVATTESGLCSGGFSDPGTPFDWYFEIDGSDLDVLMNGGSVCTGTTTDHSGVLDVGILMTDNDDPHTVDDFEGADLAAPPATGIGAWVWWW